MRIMPYRVFPFTLLFMLCRHTAGFLGPQDASESGQDTVFAVNPPAPGPKDHRGLALLNVES